MDFPMLQTVTLQCSSQFCFMPGVSALVVVVVIIIMLLFLLILFLESTLRKEPFWTPGQLTDSTFRNLLANAENRGALHCPKASSIAYPMPQHCWWKTAQTRSSIITMSTMRKQQSKKICASLLHLPKVIKDITPNSTETWAHLAATPLRHAHQAQGNYTLDRTKG